MELNNLHELYAPHPVVGVLSKMMQDSSVKTIFAGNLCASSAAVVASELYHRRVSHAFVYILKDLEEAGYFYHDLTQMEGTARILFFPSSFRRALKYGQRDAASEILRTEVLSEVQKLSEKKKKAEELPSHLLI